MQSSLRHAELHRPFSSAGGHAYIAEIPAAILPSLAAGKMAIVAEDGVALGPAGTLHQHIRDRGRGAFSIWGTHVYLSASDGSDCNANGRTYSLELTDLADPSIRDELARNDALLLDLLDRNRNQNNSVIGNFLNYFQVLSRQLRKHGIPLPRRALELGSGKKPYTALRFLAEGVELFAANDVQRIDRALPPGFTAQLIELLGMVDGDSADRLRSLISLGADGTSMSVRGLEILDERPFETLEAPRDLDLVFSTSVLEHVDQPRAVVARMFDLLRSGGHAWHSIDLRDHCDFTRPLEFLRMTPEQYSAIATENRLRASAWQALFLEAGFEIVDRRFATIRVGTTDGTNHLLVHSSQPPVELWVTEAMRDGFAPPFAGRDLVDLSVLGTTFLCRKP